METRRLTWLVRRLSKMSPVEIGGRVRDALVKEAWRRRWFRPEPRITPYFPIDPQRFTLPAPDQIDPPISAVAYHDLIETADRIMEGKITILGIESNGYGEAPDWFRNPLSGKRAPDRQWCFDVPYRDAAKMGEVKYVWEPSRHQHLTVLAAAYWLTGRTRYAERAAAHLRSWWALNPFLHGIHWTSGIEMGIRLISWVWIRRLLNDWPLAASLFEDNPMFRYQLYYHQAYLAALPSRGSSANNHLAAEITGQFVASSCFPLFEESAGWRLDSARAIDREIVAQTFPDGLNRELATSYHGLTFELFLTALVEDDADSPLLSPECWVKLAAMADAMASMSDARGRPPAQGDDDGAFGLMVDGAHFDRWHSLLAVTTRLVGPCPWWTLELAMACDMRAALLAYQGGHRPVQARPAQPINHFVEGGMVLLRGAETGAEEIWCRCDNGPLGFLSTAAHGHADALSVEVRYGGVDILADPGTYCYQGSAAWRAYFRSTIGHNCLELDGIDQARSGGCFMWLDRTKSRLESLTDLGESVEWVASHRGYQRLIDGATHRRRVHLDRTHRILEIADIAVTNKSHPARLAFHLGPQVTCRIAGNIAHLGWRGKNGPRSARFHLPPALDWKTHRGETKPTLGWYSAGFGLIEPSITLVGSGALFPGQQLRSVLMFDPVAEPMDERRDAYAAMRLA